MTECLAGYARYPELYWAPIRHHSPHCAWQLRRLIDSVRPDVLLVEGPSEANDLLPALLDEQTRPPVALFIHNTVSGSDAGARCFVPFAAMSPEWVALREGKRLGIATRFIDLPFKNRQSLLEQGSEGTDLTLEPPLNDDRPLARGDAMAGLLALSDCADFEQWWARYFESGVAYAEPSTFFADLLQLGHYLRAGSASDALTHAREAHMAAAINQARAQGQRCLIVCGAFHCHGILDLLDEPTAEPLPGTEASGVHLVSYSLQRLNATAGYAAGIPDCAYQARVWSILTRRRELAGDAQLDAQASLAPELLGELRRRQLPASLIDVIEGVTMAQRLAALRGYRAGRLEFREALLSTLLKNQRDGAELPLLEAIDQFLAGDEVGRLPPGLPVPPLVADFRQQCRRLRLPRGAGVSVERVLELYRSPLHREQSRLLHRLASLEVPYASRLAGPRFSSGQDLARVREVWSIRWQPETEALLTERSHYGARLLDAATARCRERMATARREGRECVSLLIDALCMGLHELLAALLDQVAGWLQQARDLSALCRGLHLLDAARHARTAFEGDGLEALDGLLALCFQRICLILPRLANWPDESQHELLDALAEMLKLVVLQTPGCDAASFYEALQLLLAGKPAPTLAGLAQAALLEAGQLTVAQVADGIRTAGAQVLLDAEVPGRFLTGLLKVARYRLLQESELQRCMGEVMQGWDEQTFLQALPGLRLAFTQYSPRQLVSLAKALQTDGAETWGLPSRQWSAGDLERAAQLRVELAQARQYWDGEQ